MNDNDTTKIVDLKVRIGTEGANQFQSILLKQYAMEEIEFDLVVSNWRLESGETYYTQRVNGLPITAETEGVVGIKMPTQSSAADDAMYKKAAKAQLRCIKQGDGYLILKCYGVLPDVDIPCHITSVYNPLTTPPIIPV